MLQNRQPEARFSQASTMASLPDSAWSGIALSTPRAAYPPPSQKATARRAKGFLHGFLLPHALAFYAGVLGLSNDHDALTALAGYILAHKSGAHHLPGLYAWGQHHEEAEAARCRNSLRATPRARLGDADPRTSPVHPNHTDRQSCCPRKVCRTRKGGSRTAERERAVIAETLRYGLMSPLSVSHHQNCHQCHLRA